jgi:hypothetical protein
MADIQKRKPKQTKHTGKKMSPGKTRKNSPASRFRAKCPDSIECIGFGEEIFSINAFFDNFTNFNLIDDSKDSKKIGDASANGFIYKLSYLKDGYSSLAILKSTQNVNSDNLMYEYNVGLFINGMCPYYTCFLETYGLFKYKTIADYTNFKTNDKVSKAELNTSLTSIPLNYAIGCKNSQTISLLVQYVNGISLADLIQKNRGDLKFVNYDIWCILFQIYYSLSALQENFTHYDLHTDNVMVYEPSKDTYITYNYYLLGGNITFKSRYIAKILDYGHSYFNNGYQGGSSVDVYNETLATKSCDSNSRAGRKADGGTDYGMPWGGLSAYNIDTRRRNVSADLRLIYMVGQQLISRKAMLNQYIPQIINSIVFDPMNKYSKYCTDEMHQSVMQNGYIYNVSDAFECIAMYLATNSLYYENPAVIQSKSITIEYGKKIVIQ